MVRKAKRDDYPIRDGSWDPTHHGQHRLGAPFVSQAPDRYSSLACAGAYRLTALLRTQQLKEHAWREPRHFPG